MSMTVADWNAWSLERRTFYVALFTAYLTTENGMLCSDVKKRQSLVRMQIERQKAVGAEQILTFSFLANYILTDGLQGDGKTLKKSEDVNAIKVLCSQRSAMSGKEPSQHVLVGGFKPPDQAISLHFKKVVKDKMCGGAEVESNEIAAAAVLLPLAETNDLTFFSSCALHPDEKQFFIEDPLFREAIKVEAERLSTSTGAFKLSAVDIEQNIINYINSCSENVRNQRSLASVSVPRVQTFLALYTTKKFKTIEEYVTGIQSTRDLFYFQGHSASLSHYLVGGILEFTLLSEVGSLLKALFLLKGPFAGQSIDVVKKDTMSAMVSHLFAPPLIKILLDVTKAQTDNIKAGKIAILPTHMSIVDEGRWGVVELLKILRNMQSINLYHIAEMAGFSPEYTHLAFGLESNAVVDEICHAISQFWDAESLGLLRGIERFLEKQGVDFRSISFIAAGICLGVSSSKKAVQVAPSSIGLFSGSEHVKRDLRDTGETYVKVTSPTQQSTSDESASSSSPKAPIVNRIFK